MFERKKLSQSFFKKGKNRREVLKRNKIPDGSGVFSKVLIHKEKDDRKNHETKGESAWLIFQEGV